MSPRWRAALAVTAALLLAASACAKESSDDPLAFDPEFYEAPDLPAAGVPGDLLRSDEIPGVPGGGRMWRVLYRSESVAGAPIAVSGIVAAPQGEPPPGGWPVLSLAHGTVGLADACAPSRNPGTTASEAAKNGFVVVASDYEGLGTAGRHPYLVGASEARGVIDAVRAARAMGAEVSASDRYVVLGYSQGGHAALFANEIAGSWAPELHLAGTVAGAPVVEMGAWLDFLTEAGQGWLVASVVAGFAAADAAADPAAVLTPAALGALPVVDEECSTGISAAFSAAGAVLSRPLGDVAAFAQQVAANTPGQVAGGAPLLIVHGGADQLIPRPLIDAALDRMCAAGQSVELKTYPGVDHHRIIQASFDEAALWLLDRLADKPAPSSC